MSAAIIVKNTKIRLNPLTISRKIQADGSCMSSARPTHHQTQTISPHRSAYHRLKSRMAIGPTK